jgi:hypothetical protein
MLQLPKTIKARVWRELVGYDPLADGKFDYDGCVEKLALVYGVDKQVIEDEFDLDQLLPAFVRAVEFVNGQVLAGLEELPKKKETE